MPYEDALAVELEAAVHLAGTPDFSEGLRAFLEKRPPKWE
jgi:enoyl-CoA hydratase/carnithine racemase